uniref:Transmembrane protein n=1 Tax=Chromera velia CCMP2878 TaxID=1169474 RepID=A0A0G4HGU8_9ALVE|eukprot:Cvel_27454.t1-p1 / transcript=Cvel_27454.t1 / gene=Cvel_27454 / organism=Chromera_velia_CCMP2878 / gene_product=hypothetical protein / transcript_product=hypothetical protein / location=Cvel_scaffold3428:5160-7717(+) / protein_length=274 / sequence_SO=supercontig / SO=protein_coding / is_pseudo=false
MTWYSKRQWQREIFTVLIGATGACTFASFVYQVLGFGFLGLISICIGLWAHWMPRRMLFVLHTLVSVLIFVLLTVHAVGALDTYGFRQQPPAGAEEEAEPVQEGEGETEEVVERTIALDMLIVYATVIGLSAVVTLSISLWDCVCFVDTEEDAQEKNKGGEQRISVTPDTFVRAATSLSMMQMQEQEREREREKQRMEGGEAPLPTVMYTGAETAKTPQKGETGTGVGNLSRQGTEATGAEAPPVGGQRLSVASSRDEPFRQSRGGSVSSSAAQ